MYLIPRNLVPISIVVYRRSASCDSIQNLAIGKIQSAHSLLQLYVLILIYLRFFDLSLWQGQRSCSQLLKIMGGDWNQRKLLM
jgi:hypothetical protein